MERQSRHSLSPPGSCQTCNRLRIDLAAAGIVGCLLAHNACYLWSGKTRVLVRGSKFSDRLC